MIRYYSCLSCLPLFFLTTWFKFQIQDDASRVLSAILLFHVYRKFEPHFYFRSRQSEAKRRNSRLIFPVVNQPGGVAHACNPATRTLGSLNGLRVGFLGAVVLCRSGVRAKFGVNMGNTEESEFSRLVKEERTGPGWKHSRQKLPRQTVVG